MRTIQDLRKDEEDIRSLKGRSGIILSFLFILIILGNFKILQLIVVDGDDYEAESDKNRIIDVPIYPSRGLIRLQDGTIVAENIVTQGIFIKKQLLESSQDEIQVLYEKVLDKRRKFPGIKEIGKEIKIIWLAVDLSEREISKYQVHKNSIPNLQLDVNLRRYLPHKHLFSHVIGHLGKINSQERLALTRQEYPADSFIGKVGLEKVYEKQLKGSIGSSILEVDVYGNKIREINRIIPIRPSDLTLTLDFELQKIAKDELAGRRGAIVALDPKTGFIKALVSSPDYNPNILNGSEKDSLVIDSYIEEAPFFNRAISGSYPPASTIKPFIGLLGLEEEIINSSTIIEDIGFFQLKEKWKKVSRLERRWSWKS